MTLCKNNFTSCIDYKHLRFLHSSHQGGIQTISMIDLLFIIWHYKTAETHFGGILHSLLPFFRNNDQNFGIFSAKFIRCSPELGRARSALPSKQRPYEKEHNDLSLEVF